VSDITRLEPSARYSRVVIHNGTAYFSGLTADDRSGDIRSQTEQVLAKADRLLGTAGSSRAQLLTAMIWLREIDDFAGMNAVWETWVDREATPARATVESKLAAPDVRVEIQFTAAIS